MVSLLVIFFKKNFSPKFSLALELKIELYSVLADILNFSEKETLHERKDFMIKSIETLLSSTKRKLY